jgi:hypothetical protein
MRTQTRRLLVGTAAGLALALATPLVPAAEAHGLRGGPETGRHGWHSTQNPATWQARKVLVQSLRAASATLRTQVRAARLAYWSDPAVVAARATRDGIVQTATDPALILAANDAFLLETNAAAGVRDAAIAAAVTTWETNVEAAWVVYDTATLPASEAAARATYRASVRTAVVTFRAALKTANATFRASTASANATMRAAINAAHATFEASAKGDADKQAFCDAVAAARAAFLADPAVVDAFAARKQARADARTAYKTSLKAAKDAFFAATGHNPVRLKLRLPRV